MKWSAREYLLHIRDEAEFIRRVSAGLSRESLLRDEVWDVVTDKVPVLMREVEQILTDEDL
ncbi:MAG TPA: hypothetical protein VM936_12380 [Pyrinomonadaceae bacterium]|nr:hypothetical protein [Pyrinomonadaceae bacterium]